MMDRETDAKIAEFIKLKLGPHPHDLSEGAYRCVQCSVCGTLMPEDAGQCRCKAVAALSKIVNPRIPKYHESFKDAWELLMAIKAGREQVCLFWTKTEGWGVEIDDEKRGKGNEPQEAICDMILNLSEQS